MDPYTFLGILLIAAVIFSVIFIICEKCFGIDKEETKPLIVKMESTLSQ